MNSIKKISLTSFIFWLFIIALTTGLLIPMPEGKGTPGVDKVIHFSAFLILGLLHFFEFGRTAKGFTLLIIYSMLIEFAQGLTSYRSFELLDMIANLAGCLTSGLLYFSKYKSIS